MKNNNSKTILKVMGILFFSSLTIQQSMARGKVHEEKNGFTIMEAIDYNSQSNDKLRKWEIIKDKENGDFMQILPDTRKTHKDKLINGENFSDEAGKVAVIHYKINITNPGRYYVWVSSKCMNSEDNGVHVGIDGTWPESGKRMQWCDGKKVWTWCSRQRTAVNHCGELGKIYLDINKPGIHDLQFSMREDGFSMKQIALSTDYNITKHKEIKGNISFNETEFQMISKWTPILSDGYSENYYEPRNKAFAINTIKQPTDKWSEMKTTFNGENDNYKLIFTSLFEKDGECCYKVLIDGKEILNFQNPRIQGQDIKDYTPYKVSIDNVCLKKNSEIIVLFRPDSNGLVPEKDAFAFARDRWQDLQISKEE